MFAENAMNLFNEQPLNTLFKIVFSIRTNDQDVSAGEINNMAHYWM